MSLGLHIAWDLSIEPIIILFCCCFVQCYCNLFTQRSSPQYIPPLKKEDKYTVCPMVLYKFYLHIFLMTRISTVVSLVSLKQYFHHWNSLPGVQNELVLHFGCEVISFIVPKEISQSSSWSSDTTDEGAVMNFWSHTINHHCSHLKKSEKKEMISELTTVRSFSMKSCLNGQWNTLSL